MAKLRLRASRYLGRLDLILQNGTPLSRREQARAVQRLGRLCGVSLRRDAAGTRTPHLNRPQLRTFDAANHKLRLFQRVWYLRRQQRSGVHLDGQPAARAREGRCSRCDCDAMMRHIAAAATMATVAASTPPSSHLGSLGGACSARGRTRMPSRGKNVALGESSAAGEDRMLARIAVSLVVRCVRRSSMAALSTVTCSASISASVARGSRQRSAPGPARWRCS